MTDIFIKLHEKLGAISIGTPVGHGQEKRLAMFYVKTFI